MDQATCLNAVISGLKQYNWKNDEYTFSCLLSHLDALISITGKGSPCICSSSGDFLFNQCLSSLVNALSNIDVKYIFAQKILTLFSSLANRSAMCNSFRNSYDLLGKLLEYFKLCLSPPHDLNILMCIKLLKKITYKHQVNLPLSKLERLLDYLLKNLENTESNETKYCLGLLANLTFNIPAVQCFIKSKENLKTYLKKLMAYMSNTNHKTQVFAISILCNICLHDDIGDKIFKDQNLLQMFHFLFNVLHVSKPGIIQSYVVDLFVTILDNDRICNELAEYVHLPQCLHLITSNIDTPDPNNLKAVLQLLLAFTSVPKLKVHIYNIDCKHLACQSSLDSILEQGAACLFSSLITSITKDEKQSLTVSILCLNLIEILYCQQQAQMTNFKKEKLNIIVDALSRIFTSCHATHDCSRSPKFLKAFQLLKKLHIRANEIIDSHMCIRIIKMHINCSNDIFHDSSYEMDNEDEPSNNFQHLDKNHENKIINEMPCFELVVELVEFIGQFHHDKINLIIEDYWFAPFMARGLSSPSETCNFKTLKILLLRPDCLDISLLANYLARINQRKLKWKLPIFLPQDFYGKIPLNTALASNVNDILNTLVERLKINPEANDLKVSEIISLYEFKFQDMQMKESMTQNLLHVKGDALSQCEKALSQMKLRLTQHEAEARGLRLILLDSEKHKEGLTKDINKLACKLEALQQHYDVLSYENARLTEVEQNFKSTMLSFSAVSQKLEICQQSLENLKQDHHDLAKIEEMRKKRNYELETKIQLICSKLEAAEDDKSQLKIELGKKDSRISELTKMVESSEDNLAKRTERCNDLESIVEKLQSELSRSSQVNKDMCQEVSSLEMKIKDQEAAIHQQKSELDNYVKAAALFHSLTSRNVKQKPES